ncbi:MULTISPECIES: MFS transporter [unclassified Novosphingobium]|uniref:spinster family MFS transporter n=1 Tax=unclassified Novosphingobium TaxID=2644732 RepID=UPI0025D143F0|nr:MULTISPECIES: MFS transporter [unclassified Novosphingobium]HQV02031.1 MFS transporter [Novosphingobium sp.]
MSATGPNASEHSSVSSWGLLALLTVINVLNFVDRQLLPSFANFIKPELGLSDTQFGLLTGLFFIVFYAVAGLLMGVLADRMHRGRLIALAIAAWSLLTAVSGAAKGFVSMAVPRALIGVGESALTPAAASLVADRFKPSQLGLAMSLYYLGVPIGAGASLLVAGYLGPTIGWRNCFYLLGAIGMVLAALMWLVRDDRVVGPPVHSHGPGWRGHMRVLIAALRQSPALCLVIGGGVALHIAVGAAAFDQLWFVEERGFERAEIAKLTGFMTVVAGIAGSLFGGYAGDWWYRTRKSGRAMLLFWMILALAPLTLGFRIVPADSIWFVPGIGAGIFLLCAYYGPAVSTIQELSPPSSRATVVAFNILCVNAVGLGIGITATGALIDLFRAAGSAQPYSSAALSMSVVSMLALPAFFLAGHWFHRDKARVDAAQA